MARLLLAAGGTGGHMFPAQALAEILTSRGWEVAMITDVRGRKHTANIPADPILDVKAATISPRRPVQSAIGTMQLARGVQQAKAFIKDWQPDVVAGFGGYPAFPAMRAAQSLRIPSLIHEQNAVLGRVNRVFATKARLVASGFDTLEKCPRRAVHVVTGNPLRQQIINAIPKTYALPSEQINLLIVGGSLGAKIISEAMPKAVALLSQDLRDRLWVVQQTRAENLIEARETYEKAGVTAICEGFFGNIETYLAKAHLVVGRAGASSVSEIAAMGKPSLLVPLKIAMDDHQTANAQSLNRLGAADILPESEFNPHRIAQILTKRLTDENWLATAAATARAQGRPNAAIDLAERVISCS